MKEKIQTILKQIEKEHQIEILFAIENGSRAWGFSSKDSDYDIRFVFKRNISNYISLDKPKEVINIAYNDKGEECDTEGALIDISGFDVFKYTKLLSKSNPTAIEWLISDIIYIGEKPSELSDYMQSFFNPQALFFHYQSICKNNYINFIISDKSITHKKYLYILRGLLNAMWVYKNDSIPPLHFTKTLEKSDFLDKNIKSKISDIINLKSEGKEKDSIEKIDDFDKIIEDFLNQDFNNINKTASDLGVFNSFLRKTILN